MTIYYSDADAENPYVRRSQPSSAHKKSRKRGKGRKDRHSRHPMNSHHHHHSNHKHPKKKNHFKIQQRQRKHQQKQQQQQQQGQGQRVLAQAPFDLKSFDPKNFDPKTFDPKSIDLKSLDLPNIDMKNFDVKSLDVNKIGEKLTGTLAKSSLPAGLKFPKELTLEQLQSTIAKFHWNETRTDLRTPLPMDFEADKSIFTFLYTINHFKDPTVIALLFIIFFRLWYK